MAPATPATTVETDARRLPLPSLNARSLGWTRVGLAAMGASWCLGFAPWGIWPWPFVALWLLQQVLNKQLTLGLRARQAWLHGFSFFIGAFGVGVSWLYTSLHTFGGLAAPLAVLAIAGFSAFLALYGATACLLYAAYTRTYVPGVFSKALLWAALCLTADMLRGWVFTGFPWLSLGDGMVDSPLVGWLPLVGSQATAGVFLFSGSLASAWLTRTRTDRVFAIAGAVMLCVVVWLGQLWSQDPWGSRVAGFKNVQLVQPNIEQSIKFEPSRIIDNVEKTLLLTRQAADIAGPGDWVLLPETALPVLWSQSPKAWKQAFQSIAHNENVHIVMGVALEDEGQFSNSVVALQPSQETYPEHPQPRYDKRHLVPFGEFIPPGFAWFVSLLDMPMGEFARGQGRPQVFDMDGFRLLPHVCYEDVFGREFAALVRHATEQPQVLFNVSNLAWFGDSPALHQHAQMSAARAAELRKPMLRATNTGATGYVDAYGHWVNRLPFAQEGVLPARVTLMEGLTPYARWGDTALFSALAFAFFWCLGTALARKRTA